MARRRDDDATIIYVGPTLPAAEVRALAPTAELAPPVAALDVARLLLRRRPARLVILDGYFERMAAVWHKELLLAIERGVEVWGAASMGALRAAELEPFGMRGVGAIYRSYRRGAITGDDEVAVAHLPAEGRYLPLSVPLVTVRATVAAARAAGALDGGRARAVLQRARDVAYWDRRWEPLDEVGGARFATWRPAYPIDPKADDARALLRTLATTLPVRTPGLPVPRTWAFEQLLALAARPARARR